MWPRTCCSVSSADGKAGKNRLHLDLRPEDQAAEVERLLALGATLADIGQGDEVSWVVMADPEGNEFCILEPYSDEQLAQLAAIRAARTSQSAELQVSARPNRRQPRQGADPIASVTWTPACGPESGGCRRADVRRTGPCGVRAGRSAPA